MTNINLDSLSQIQKNIADFILKLYTILENTNLSQIITWSTNGQEILIKDKNKMEAQILPIYFRHQKIQSFIRQLNMYNFSKVNKIGITEKSYLIFKNTLFRKGEVHLLHRIYRKKKGQEDNTLSLYQQLENYRLFIKQNVIKIQDDIQQLKNKYPQLSLQLNQILIGTEYITGQNYFSGSQYLHDAVSTTMIETPKSLLATTKNLSQNYFFYQFDSKCSIDNEILEDIKN